MRTLLAALIALGVSGCASGSMIRTVDRTTPLPPTWNASEMSYLGEYALPRSRFVVTVSSPSGAAPAAASAPTVTNTITVTTVSPSTPAAPPPPPSQGSGDLADWCRGHRQTYNRNLRTLADATVAWSALNRRLGTEAVEFSAAERNLWKADLTRHLDTFSAADVAYGHNLSALSLVIPTCPQAIRVQISEVVERDPARTFALYSAHDDAASDSLKLALSAGGFVTQISGTANDRSIDIAVGGAKTLASVVTTFNPPAPAAPPIGVNLDPECPASGSAAFRAGAARQRLEADAPLDQESVACILALLAPHAELPAIDVALPFEVSLVPDTARPIDGLAVQSFAFDGAGSSLGLNGAVTCAVGLPSTTEGDVASGLAVSTAMPCEAIVRRGTAEIARANAWSLNSQQTSVLATPRTPFVSQTFSYSFADGRQTGAESSRPSPLENVVSAPARLIGGVVEAIASGVAGETGRIKAETALTEAETARLTAAARLLEAQTAAAGRAD